MSGVVACCARAAIGQANADPRLAMNSLRRIVHAPEPLAKALELGRLSDHGELGPALQQDASSPPRFWAVRGVLVAGRPLLVYPDQRTYFETVLV